MIRLEPLVDRLTDAERQDLAAELEPSVCCAHSRVVLRIVQLA